MADEIKYPAGFGLKDVASQTVIKTPLFEDCEHLVSREREIYERLAQRGGHEGILCYHGTVESGIQLEYAPNGDIRTFFEEQGDAIPLEQRLRWATQIAEALGFIHSAGIVHGDVTCHNIFLDEGLNAKVADFAGSSLDGSKLLIGVTASHECPGSTLSTQGDIFAFASVVYEIMTGSPPYTGLSDAEINACYKQSEFPDTASLGEIGAIITKCWLAQYDGFEAVAQDLREVGT
ncbi:kinase-like domain-containing protein [Parachaetomium inaequale]|uniref:EKC/KEOPS complex subunit BUD32 n=1 Tax=Parachaetomium inaequale TaxID=2588326 RepID=A0AAN6P8P8_9PEZI|nr:kinase-like domain-containing protein [Parachaetomium inaequale]